MKRQHKSIQLLISLILVSGLFAPAIFAKSERTSLERIQPQLAAMIAEAPNQSLRIIVQKSAPTHQPEHLVAELGGKITKQFRIINGFAADMPAKAILKLAQVASVNWVSLDAPMTFATSWSPTVRDEFNSPSFGNNDGSVNWKGPWIEDDSAGAGVTKGNVDIYNGGLRFDDNPNTGTYPSAAREVDLSSGVDTAIFSFDYQTGPGGDRSDQVAIEISANGGTAYTTLEIIGGFSGSVFGSRSFDITPYLSANTMIRFRVQNYYGAANEYFLVDNVQIEVGIDQNHYLDTLGIDQLHASGLTGQGVTVAVVDSGIANHPDFAGRLVTTPEYGIGDSYGHGTHVAGIIGSSGSASGGAYAGVAPGVNLISLGVSDEFGMSYESDVVEALQWAHENKDTYNIRVVNLSLNSTVEDSFHNSAINAAAEILWFNSVVVVVSAGNTGEGGSYNTIRTAPANDPYVIVVGASKEYDTPNRVDDTITSFSSHGITLDGFSRPDVIAPGYNIYSTLSPDSSWDDSHPDRLAVGGEYIRLSGTSMSAPVVAGTVALLLQDEPNLTPDQVKYRLVATGSTIFGTFLQIWPYLDAYAAIHGTSTQDANQDNVPHNLLAQMAMIAYWASVNGDEVIDWENIDWDAVNWESVNWNSVNWNSVNWNSVNWNSVNWNSVNWNSVNWNSVNWNSVNWNSVNWNSVNWNSVLNPPDGDSPNGGSGKSGAPTRSDGIYWEDDEDVNPAPTACEIQAIQKGKPTSSVCVTPIWEKGNHDVPLPPVQTE